MVRLERAPELGKDIAVAVIDFFAQRFGFDRYVKWHLDRFETVKRVPAGVTSRHQFKVQLEFTLAS